MYRLPTQIHSFSVRPEAGQNPFIGFTSFQHFRNEKLYSDIIVRPEAKMTETERVECYPVSPDAEENGRAEGYYPDTSIAYIRVLWKEYEPQPGVYNDDFIAQILSDARAHDQTLIFRLMAHSTRACDDVPEWLKAMIPCPERPDGQRVKDSPTAPEFLTYFLRTVEHLGERFDADPVLEAIDISLPGAWGEGHRLDLYPPDTFRRIMDVYLAAFPTTQLMTQLGRPELIDYAFQKAGVRVGWRGDGLGEPKHTHEIYPPRVELIPDAWKHAPVSFESYWWLCEWQRKGWDIDEIIEKTLAWHLSSINAKSIPIPMEWKEKIDHWVARMGYHFAIRDFAHPDSAAPGDTAQMKLRVDNIGVAPIYHRLPLTLTLRSGDMARTFTTDADITRWLPGLSEETFDIPLPADLPDGDYAIELSITAPQYPPIYWCTDAPRDENRYRVGNIQIAR